MRGGILFETLIPSTFAGAGVGCCDQLQVSTQHPSMTPRNSAGMAFVPAASLSSIGCWGNKLGGIPQVSRPKPGLINLRSQHDSDRGATQKPRSLGTPRSGAVARAARGAALLGAFLSLSLAPLSLPTVGFPAPALSANAEEPQALMLRRDLPVDTKDPYAQVSLNFES